VVVAKKLSVDLWTRNAPWQTEAMAKDNLMGMDGEGMGEFGMRSKLVRNNRRNPRGGGGRKPKAHSVEPH